MLKQLKRFTLQVIAGANIATILVMLFVGYSDRVSPETFPTLSTAGLAFPAILVVNLAFLLFWLIFKPLYALIPIGGLLLGRPAMPKPVKTLSSPCSPSTPTTWSNCRFPTSSGMSLITSLSRMPISFVCRSSR